MEINTGLLLFLFIFFVLPLIQRVLRGQKQPPPPGSRPGQHVPGVPPGRTEGRTRLPDRSPHTGEPGDGQGGNEPVRAQAERATDLIPDDLWEILTGERRTPAPSQRQHGPDPEQEAEPYEFGTDAQEGWQPEEPAVDGPETYDEEAYQASDPLETPWRRDQEETARKTTTAQAPAPITASRSVSQPATAGPSPYAIAAAPRAAHTRPYALQPQRRRRPPALSSRSELKRAFVLREVLGPPKALE